MISAAVSGLFLKSASDGLAKLIVDLTEKRLTASKDEGKRIKEHISPHISEIYNKCISIKTLLNPHSPAKFLEIYSTQRFLVGSDVVDQYGMVEAIKGVGNNYIISGTGGSGKSMFTRYLWLSLFLDGDGRIPLFIELRELNSFTSLDIITYIFHKITLGKSTMTDVQFKRRLFSGDFVLILDGFDEVYNEKKEALQRSIISLSEIYPDIKVVMTSRPDEKFGSWQSFDVVRVAPMLQQDAVELVEKAEFESDTKKKFKKIISNLKFFKDYNSFLSNPLLTCMMLLTYSHNFSIPEKMHLFYEQAFDALYSRHDSHKPGGYKRQFNVNLSEDEFKRLFSYFCLVTYYDEKVTFSKIELISYINKAVRLEGCSIDPDMFLNDLVNSVCMLVPDGIVYSFSHRSFQEFFAAYCLSYVSSGKYRDIVVKIASRTGDIAIKLLNDMNEDLFRRLYVVPISDEYSSDLQLGKRVKSFSKSMAIFGMKFVVEYYTGRPRVYNSLVRLVEMDEEEIKKSGFGAGRSEAVSLLLVVNKLRPRRSVNNDDTVRDEDACKKLQKLFKIRRGDRLNIKGGIGDVEFYIEKATSDTGVSEIVNIGENSLAMSIIKESYMYEYFVDHLLRCDAYVKEVKKTTSSSNDALNDFFSDR